MNRVKYRPPTSAEKPSPRLKRSSAQVARYFFCSSLVGSAPFLFCNTAHAGAFQLFEQGATAVATGAANQAEAKDASAVFWNAAALTRLPGTNFSGAFNLVQPTGKLSDVSGQTTIGALPISGGSGGSPGTLTFAAPLFYAKAISPNTTVGLSLTAPFGLAVEYAAGWVGRYQVLEASLRTFDFGLAVGYEVSPTFSIGLGVDLQYAKIKVDTAIDLSTACLGASLVVPGLAAQCAANGFSVPGNAAVDGRAALKQDSFGKGWNAGILWHPTPDFRLGLAYRSKVSHDFAGDANFTKPATLPTIVSTLPALSDSGARTKLSFPETATTSLFFQATDRWSMMGAATWTRWSRLDQVRTTFDNGTADSVLLLDWKNTWRLSGAVGYRVSPALTLRAGAVFDQSPTTSARSPTLQIPDRDRHAFSLGGSYKVNEATTVDFGAIQYQLKEIPIDQNSAQTGSFTGTFRNVDVFVLSIQANYRF